MVIFICTGKFICCFGVFFMCSFFPHEYEMKAYPLSMYPAKCQQAACIQLMIMNNLDARYVCVFSILIE